MRLFRLCYFAPHLITGMSLVLSSLVFAQTTQPSASQLLGTFAWQSYADSNANHFDEALISITVTEQAGQQLQVRARVDLGEGKASDDYVRNPFVKLHGQTQYIFQGTIGGKKAEPNADRLVPYDTLLVFPQPLGTITGWHLGYESYVDGSHPTTPPVGQRESPALLDTVAPQLRNVRLSSISSTTVTIRCETDEPARTQVQYGPTLTYGNFSPPTSALAIEHAIQLTGLSPNTGYHYRVIASDAAGNAVYSTDATFASARHAPDTLTVRDDFNRADLGPDWTREPEFWQITEGELDHTPEAWKSWRYLTVYNPVSNGDGREIIEVSYRWGKNVTALGVREGALALMVDEDSPHANGYWLWHRYGQVWLWTINNGEYVGGRDLGRWHGASDPGAGDVVTIKIRQEQDGNYFDYYINGDYSATAEDPARHFPKSENWYVGFFLRGEEMNNEIDEFSLTYIQKPGIAPEAPAPIAAQNNDARPPQEFFIDSNYPNPFQYLTQMSLHLNVASRVSAAIYNLQGQEILSLYQGSLPTGSHQLRWHGTTETGQAASNGIYFLHVLFTTDNGTKEMLTRRLILAR
ncbi:hypothetical protein DCC62_18790 [candidate division KSB1 bacterium]|nr:MAG: hypothetical protein DCC62_18790 [candidate division KSB1 bacterium]